MGPRARGIPGTPPPVAGCTSMCGVVQRAKQDPGETCPRTLAVGGCTRPHVCISFKFIRLNERPPSPSVRARRRHLLICDCNRSFGTNARLSSSTAPLRQPHDGRRISESCDTVTRSHRGAVAHHPAGAPSPESRPRPRPRRPPRRRPWMSSTEDGTRPRRPCSRRIWRCRSRTSSRCSRRGAKAAAGMTRPTPTRRNPRRRPTSTAPRSWCYSRRRSSGASARSCSRASATPTRAISGSRESRTRSSRRRGTTAPCASPSPRGSTSPRITYGSW